MKITPMQRLFLEALAAQDKAVHARIMRRIGRSYGRLHDAVLAKGLTDIIRTPNAKWLRDDLPLVLTDAGRQALEGRS